MIDCNAAVKHWVIQVISSLYWLVPYSVTITNITLLNKIAEQCPRVHALNASVEIVDALEKVTQLGLITESLESFSTVSLEITFEKVAGQW